ARWLAGAVADQGPGRAVARQAPGGTDGGGRRAAGPGGSQAAGRPEPVAVPRPDKGIRGASRAVWGHLEPVGEPVLLWAAPRRRAPGAPGARRGAVDRARG